MNSPTDTQTTTDQIGAVQGAWLVAEREILMKLRSKAFIISTATLLLAALIGVLVMGFISNGTLGGPTKVVLVDVSLPQLAAAGFEVSQASSRTVAEELVLSGAVDAAVLTGGNTAVGLTVLAAENAPSDLVMLLSASPTVELLAPVTDNPWLAMIIGMAFGVIFMMTAITFGATIAQSVVEEKQTRIIEILLPTVSARTILAGKVIGNSILALGSVIAVISVASIGMLATGQNLLLGELGTSLIWFGILFAFGFVLLAAMYATLASLVSRQEDIASATAPLMILVMAPYILVVIFAQNLRVLAVMSYIPFSAPVGMPMRLYLGTAQWWEPYLSLTILLTTIALVLVIGARIYENSILRIGAKVKISEALKR